MPADDRSQRRSTSKGRPLALVVLAILLTIAGWFGLRRPPPAAPAVPAVVPQELVVSPELSAEELDSASRQARLAIGLLENEKFADAARIFETLAEQLPQEPLAVRNLAICWILESENPSGSPDLERLERSLGKLAQVEPESAVAHWLAARAELQLAERNLGDRSRSARQAAALDKLRAATRRDPQSASYWYEIYLLGRDSSDPARSAEARGAIGQAYRVAPANLRVMLDWLFDRATHQDAELAAALPAIRERVEPIAPGVERRTRLNVLEFFDQLQSAVTNQQWPQTRQAAMRIRNFLASEELTRSDLRLIHKNPLEFVVHELRPETRRRLPQPPPPAAPIPVRFAVAQAGEELPSDIAAALLDHFDFDGQPDLFLLRRESLEIRRLLPGGTVGELVSSLPVPAGMTQLLVADLDRDTIATPGTVKAAAQTPGESFYEADADVVLYGTHGLRVLNNSLADDGQTRTLEAVPQDPEFEALRDIRAGLLADIDHDGDLDLVLSIAGRIQVWWNRGNLTFEDATRWSLLPPAELQVESLAAVDWDRDVDLDILVAGVGSSGAGILENLRHGQLRWQPFDPAFQLGAPLSLAPIEADGNASWDLVAAGPDGIRLTLTTTIPGQAVRPLRNDAVDARPFQRVRRWDYDNDGVADLLAFGAESAALFRGERDGTFSRADGVLPEEPLGMIADVEDLDRDGDLDLLTLAGGQLGVLRNDGGNQNHWLRVRVRGEAEDRSGRVNHFGIGSLLELKAGPRYQAQIVQKSTAHFGLGATSQADVLRVLFTNGIPQSVIQPAADQLVSELMVNKGSCPFVYGWDGERFEFITDLLWNAPLGLQLSDGVLAPDRPWEYLKIRGDQCQARNGRYELRITEELWEAGYFDQVELIAVDHPAGIEIYSNEKVGPAEIAQPYVHTVREARRPVSVRNHRGRDLTPQTARQDGERAVPFDRTIRKGRAEPHYIELDLGPLGSPRHVTLFLTGWIQPGDTSLNVAAFHDPGLSPSQPPSLWAPDPSGVWRQVRAFLGFPGGKPKTIAVDVSEVFAGADYRLRIATDFELYWDQIFFTADDEPAEVRQTPLALLGADLHFGGFSAVTPYHGARPEEYDYRRRETRPAWPPMHGRWTRYGPVDALLEATDGRLVVMAAGDELTVHFAAGPPPPGGWVRDFLLHNVGWDKDADLNTLWGQTVEPLPFVGMRGYPGAGEMSGLHADQASPDWLRYLREYQTRTSSPAAFWRQLQ